MYQVTKVIDFCYGHRLLDYEGKCQFLHGHNGRIEIKLGGRQLDTRGMLADFGDIKRIMKEWIDNTLDHRMILHCDDPALAYIHEANEPHYVIDENPTAEAIAKLIYRKAVEFGLPVIDVVLWETPTSFATYSEGEKGDGIE